jgi:MtN3 and saliva related transmembrane protein
MTFNPQHFQICEEEKKRNPRGTIDAIMTIIGVIASLSSIPQVYKIWQTGSVEGISLLTQLLALGAVIAWCAYSMYLKNRPLFITSFLSIIILGTVAVQIIVLR